MKLCGKIAELDNSNLLLTCDIEVLTGLFVKIMVFWDVTLCNLVDGCLHHPGTFYPRIWSRRVNSKTYSYTLHILHNTQCHTTDVIRCNVYISNSVYSSLYPFQVRVFLVIVGFYLEEMIAVVCHIYKVLLVPHFYCNKFLVH